MDSGKEGGGMSRALSFRRALLWSALSGFITLAWEMLWCRLYNFISASRADVLGAVLGVYLIGLAFGSLWSRRWQRTSGHVWPQLSALVLLANVVAYLIGPVTAWWVTVFDGGSLLLVLVCGTLLGVLFPVLCHHALPDDARAGSRLSYIYLANIIGSGAGSLLTGFGLMEWMSLAVISAVLLVLSYAWAESMAGGRLPWWSRALVLAVLLGTPVMFDGLYERLQLKLDYRPGTRFTTVHEGRHGVITIDQKGHIFGNGAYDGTLEMALTGKSMLVRPYIVSAFHPQPRRVLVIGVSGGVWTQILAHHPQVESLTAIEINPGYLELMKEHPQIASLLTNPKVKFIIDDGRRWLRANPKEKFDFIAMNTIIHYREFSSALLSQEFLKVVRAHLAPGGMAFWNCTGSGRAANTGVSVFPHTMMISNHCLASNDPLEWNVDRWRQVLTQYRIDGQPVFNPADPARMAELEAVLGFHQQQRLFHNESPRCWMDRSQMQEAWGHETVITDDNLGHEYPVR